MEKRTKNAMMVVRENLRIILSSKWRREEFIFST
jgi:hypothetical protein